MNAEIKGIKIKKKFIAIIFTKLPNSSRELKNVFEEVNFYCKFAFCFYMEVVAQLVRASDCGSEGRGFETHHPPSLFPPFS